MITVLCACDECGSPIPEGDAHLSITSVDYSFIGVNKSPYTSRLNHIHLCRSCCLTLKFVASQLKKLGVEGVE